MKTVMLLLLAFVSVGCSSVNAAATVAVTGSSTCSNPLSPVMCTAEGVVETFAFFYGCTEREQIKHVNGCIPGRKERVYE